MLPNFVIAGVSRSGTTSLYHYLDQHNEISFPTLKEPRYFSSKQIRFPQRGPGDYGVDKKIIRTFNEYRELYLNINNHLVGDASSEYFYNHKVAIPEILKYLGDVPIVIILRNPIDRAYSAYLNLVRDGREHLSFEDGLAAEQERIKSNYDEMWHYSQASLYSEGAQAFLTHFTKVKIINFDDFKSKPDVITQEVFEFLGVKSNYDLNTSVIFSKSGAPKNKLVSLLFGRKYKLSLVIRGIAFKTLGRKNVEKLLPIFVSSAKNMNPETYAQLKEYFESDLQNLSKITSIDTSSWI